MISKLTSSKWLAPILLLMLGSLNILFGAMQLDSILIQGPPEVFDDFSSPHYFETPIPIVLHIITGIMLNLLGPLQFVPISRNRWRFWHRWSGRLLIISGVLAGATGIWMNHYYPAYGGALKYSGIFVNSVGIIFSMGVALWAIRNRNIPQHRIWMMRAVAFGLGPATQRLIILPVFFIVGSINLAIVGYLIWSGFLINLAVVEWILWRNRRRQQGHISRKRKVA